MKKIIPAILFAFLFSSCNGWIIQPLPYNPPTPFLPATPTPSIFTSTPIIIGVTAVSSTPVVATATSSLTAVATVTSFVPVTNTAAISPTPTPAIISPAIHVDVLGCNTSIDITHGMGEVTNAYITIKNTGNIEFRNLTATLRALDEGREHPDKTVDVTILPIGYQVTLKLTVDSTYKQVSPIQIEVTADGGLFQRVGKDSCKDIGIFEPNPNRLNTPVPGNP